MKIQRKELGKYIIRDKKRNLELQKETVESFKQYFGDYEVIFETADELENKYNDFMQWRNKEWIVPGKNKTPEQLWIEAGNAPIDLPRLNLKKNFDKDMNKFGVIADPLFGIVFVPFYGYLKEFFEGNYKKVPEYSEFLYEIVTESSCIPSFVVRRMILENKDKAIEIFKEFYEGVHDLNDVFSILEEHRKDWNDSPQIWQDLVDSKRAGTIKSEEVSKEVFEEDLSGIKPWENTLIEKVIALTITTFPDEEEKALEKFKMEHKKEIKVMRAADDFNRGFQSWFLLEYKLPNGLTPIESAFNRGDCDKLFSKKEIKMLEHFLAFNKSLFEVKQISENKKNYMLKNIIDDKEYLIKTIDFPDVLSVGEFIIACIVEKLDGNFFFYGNVATYDREEGLKLKEEIKDAIKKRYRK